MSKTRLIEYSAKYPSAEFDVGDFVVISYPKNWRPTIQELLDWINEKSKVGLIYHSEYNGEFIFRVDGAVIEQLKNELKLSENSSSVYVGDNGTGSLYRADTTLLLHLDGDLISEVSLP